MAVKATVTLVSGKQIVLQGSEDLDFYLDWKEGNPLELSAASNTRRLNKFNDQVAGLFQPAEATLVYGEVPASGGDAPVIGFVPPTGRRTPFLWGYENGALTYVGAEQIVSVAIAE